MSITFKTIAVATPATKAAQPRKSATQWKEGETYVGQLLAVASKKNRFGEMKVYTFQNHDEAGNEIEGTLEVITSASLEPQLSQLVEGQLCMIQCLGKPHGSKAIQFQVAVAE